MSQFLKSIAGKCPACGQICEGSLHFAKTGMRYEFACQPCDLTGSVEVSKP